MAAQPGKGLPLPPPEHMAAAPSTSTPGCREASSSCPVLSRPCSWTHSFHGPAHMRDHRTSPAPSSYRPAGCCLMDRRAGHPIAMGGHIAYHHTHINLQLSLGAGQTTTPTAGPDTSKATKPDPRHQACLQMTCYPPIKGRLEKSSCQKPPMIDIPE